MTRLLIRLFAKKGDPNKDGSVRASYGTLGSFTGMGVNLLLSVIKLLAGLFSNSLAIVSDGINNLTDMLTCLFTLVGFRLSQKPADRDHPFGHGRYEYLTGLGVGIFILMVGAELLKTAVKKILHPESVTFSVPVLVLLLLSVTAKLWLGVFYRALAARLSSLTFAASAKDSFSDCLITLVTLLSLISSRFTALPVDGYLSALLSLWILWMGVKTLIETSSPILGKAPDSALTQAIREKLLADPYVSEVHDLLIHDYGPGQVFATAHAEVPEDGDIHALHDSVDRIEREVYGELGVHLSVHLDPVPVNDKEHLRQKALLADILSDIHPELTFHDFRVEEEPEATVLYFDIAVPPELRLSHEELRSAVAARLREISPRYDIRIFFDTDVS